MWEPMLEMRKGVTKHRLLTEKIVDDIEKGILQPAMRMPTHRDLAHKLGLSVQTVSISYKEAERRGYLRGEVGRGTYVCNRVTERADRFMLDRDPSGTADLSIIRAVYTEAHENASRRLLEELSQSDNASFMRPCRPIAGLDRHRAVARDWLRNLSVDVDPGRIILTNGAAHGLFLAVAAVVQPGEVVLTESLTDHGIIGLANVIGFTLRGLPTDEQGILPDAFETACKAGDVRALVMIPTLGNPTSHLMGAGRRIAIAEIARRYDVCVIEDEVYKPILEEKLPSMPELLPDLGFFVTSFTKTVMTGLRTGYLVVPTQYSIRVTSILRVTSWSGVNLMGEMASRWIEDGTATELIEIQRSELRSRQAQVTDILGSHVAGNNPLSLCAWLKIPRNWSEDGLVRALANKGVAVTPSDPFVAGADRGSGGIRICLGGRLSRPALQTALETIRETFAQLPPVYDVGSIA
ncbi:PLP-dependent aminotransferase family protein [Brucella intermedia]|uniref:PLP-dependent aminotransferase family protein n=1 Tax=Brucella intermedia GD04153 TaxID=2975438 RepID=A0AA42GZ23_9HYPH|nr:PLP-dependent aminotransferase family protein [Brucella intermedia]PJT21665.1 PLP-dependent aminotransferase family protein [Ochrobactrum sp. 30A/1000/2015]PJT39730.1 PLP-dependent aminotransferase family protein [Ochrobactrum sp. 27A/999/2015]PJT44024.1 PLP-dependent aminotransferase family protein [Ochrobactrum sp. 23A/997/2015]KAB2695094.1 PLP-dependent aminotransferase family protein [Brucella intermedia]KAB2709531.1 PLP-dependent aminotransferase family protein [Brucella intermedia]